MTRIVVMLSRMSPWGSLLLVPRQVESFRVLRAFRQQIILGVLLMDFLMVLKSNNRQRTILVRASVCSCLYTGHSENTLSVGGKRVSRRGRGLLALDIAVA
mmetsp:Transcript_53262/g.129396  ORF Transcript_53262/g.129396 Transcript_53262/m.129396 type:complete len:101 (+) Transcript_53262:3733-4035(+)